jgi:hypothetical protein
MYKSAYNFGLFLMVSLIVLSTVATAIPMSNMNLFSDVIAQGYDEDDSKSYNNNKNYDDNRISLHPTKVNKYECQKGPFEGFFVSSVEFCKDVPIINNNEIGTQQPPSQSGPQIIQVSTGVQKNTILSSPNQVNEPNLYFRDGNLATTNTTSHITSVAFCNPGDEVVEGFHQLTNKQGNPILGFINQITGEKNAYSTALISTNVTLQSTAFCFNNNNNS